MKKGLGASWFPSQERGGKGLGRLNMKHEKGFGCFMVPMSGVGRVWEGQKGGWALHGSQEWGGKGLGRQKKKDEKGVKCFMVHKRGVGRAWEGSNWSNSVVGMVWGAKDEA